MEAFNARVYARYAQHFGVERDVPEDGYLGDYLVEAAAAIAETEGDRLLRIPESEATLELGQRAMAGMVADAQSDLEVAFAAFENERRPNARAIQAMALENYLEMRERVDDADFLLQRALERELADRHPDRFVPRYTMVTFRRLPYAVAYERGRIQRELLVEATRGHDTLTGIDRAWLDAEVARRLSPLLVEG
jgi:hypothetical protein